MNCEVGSRFRGNELCVAAARALAPLVEGVSLDEITQDMGAFWRRVVSEARSDDDFHRALALLKRHNAIELTLGAAREHAQNAKRALSTLPANAYSEALAEISDFVVERGY